MKRKKNRSIAVLILLTVTSAFFTNMGITAFAKQADVDIDVNTDFTRLEDNNLDYDEISALVHYYNPNITSAWETFNESKTDMKRLIDELDSQKRQMREAKEQAKESQDFANIYQYATQEAIFDKFSSNYRNALTTFDKVSTQSALVRAEKQVTWGVQQLMMGYDSIVAQEQTLQEMKALYDSMYKLVSQQVPLGMATQMDQLAAQKNVLLAENSIRSLEATKNSLKMKLCVMTGWDASATPVIGEIPASDVSRIDGMHPETDIDKAIQTNYTLIDKRGEKIVKTSKNWNVRADVTGEMEEKLTIKLKALYDDVCQKKTALEAAKAGYDSAILTKKDADAKYQLGLLNEAQYIGMNMTYVQKKAAYQAADIALFQAMETYDWAVKGDVSIE